MAAGDCPEGARLILAFNLTKKETCAQIMYSVHIVRLGGGDLHSLKLDDSDYPQAP